VPAQDLQNRLGDIHPGHHRCDPFTQLDQRFGFLDRLDGCHLDPAVGVDADRSVGVHRLGHRLVGLIQLLAVRGQQLLKVLGQAQVGEYGFVDRGPAVSVLVSDPPCPPLTRWFR
jgi:hypothetical protein